MIEAEQQKAENEKQRQELIQAYKRLFQSDDGKIVKKDLESFCGFLRPSVSEHSPNSLQTHFNEGKRRVFLRINGFLNQKDTNVERGQKGSKND